MRCVTVLAMILLLSVAAAVSGEMVTYYAKGQITLGGSPIDQKTVTVVLLQMTGAVPSPKTDPILASATVNSGTFVLRFHSEQTYSNLYLATFEGTQIKTAGYFGFASGSFNAFSLVAFKPATLRVDQIILDIPVGNEITHWESY